MHFPDLSPYSYARDSIEVGVYAVGWLAAAHDYAQGLAPKAYSPGSTRWCSRP